MAQAVSSNPRRGRGRKRKQSRKQRAASMKNLRKARRSRRRNPVATAAASRPVASNPPRKKRGGSKKSRTRKSPRPITGERRVGARRRHTKTRSVSGYSRKPRVSGHRRRTNPLGGVHTNQSPFSSGNLMGFAIAAFGIGLGAGLASFVDRLWATRTPKDGTHPWMGRAAAAAIYRRPDAARLGIQAAVSLGALGGAFMLRRLPVIPWLLAGTAIGGGAKVFESLWTWYVAPMLFKADGPTDLVLGNRVYALEQKYVQDEVDTFFENYKTFPSLNAQQPPSGDPIPLNPIGTPLSVYALGGGDGDRPTARFVQTGVSGRCSKCAGIGGHWSSCEGFDASHEKRARYTVGTIGQVAGLEPSLFDLAQKAGVDADFIAGINGGRSLQTFKHGEKVEIPYALGMLIHGVISDAKARNGNGAVRHAPAPPPHLNGPAAAAPEAPTGVEPSMFAHQETERAA